MNPELNEPLLVAIERTFSASESDAVSQFLLGASGGDGVRAAILVLAYGDSGVVADLAERSRNDPRDVLILLDMVTLEFPELSNPEITRRYAELGLSRKYRSCEPHKLVGKMSEPQSSPSQSSRMNPFHVLLAIIGLSIALSGLVPMVVALGVSNILIDNGGIEQGESAIIDSWDAWAFSPWFISLALLGISLLALLLLIVPRPQSSRYAIAMLVALGVCLFIAMFVHGWFFHDIHAQLLQGAQNG